VTVAAVLLAVAVLVAPSRPGSRLRARATPLRARYLAGFLAVACAAAAAFVVPVSAMVAAAIVMATLTARRRRHLVRVRRGDEAAAIEGALAVLVGELRVGAHPVAAVEAAASEASGPVGTWLRAVAARARLGADVGRGLRAVAAESALPVHWDRLAVCWHLAQSHGLSIATLMHAAHRDVVERSRFESRVAAGMAGARATAGVLAGLPLLGVGLGQMIGADPVRFLLSGGVGGWLLVVGSTLACSGLLWSDAITNRVLT
jgi:tight adherence protein B